MHVPENASVGRIAGETFQCRGDRIQPGDVVQRDLDREVRDPLLCRYQQ